MFSWLYSMGTGGGGGGGGTRSLAFGGSGGAGGKGGFWGIRAFKADGCGGCMLICENMLMEKITATIDNDRKKKGFLIKSF